MAVEMPLKRCPHVALRMLRLVDETQVGEMMTPDDFLMVGSAVREYNTRASQRCVATALRIDPLHSKALKEGAIAAYGTGRCYTLTLYA